ALPLARRRRPPRPTLPLARRRHALPLADEAALFLSPDADAATTFAAAPFHSPMRPRPFLSQTQMQTPMSSRPSPLRPSTRLTPPRPARPFRKKLGDSYTTLGAYIKAHQTKGGDYPNEYTRSICEKVVETCQEKDLMSSSEPTILSPILDAICNGHHGGFERGCGLGWSRMSRWGDSGNQASNYNIKQLTIELQNAKSEIEAIHARDKEREEAMKAREKEREEAMKAREAEREEAMQAREREMQARMERMEAMLTMHFSKTE
ncbi:hypothetical protein Taro_043287, partial [Colocasia esculenta]|nr:hypothetical protein [Colocasia esculenta]